MSQANPTQVELDAYCMDYLTNGGNQSAAFRVAFPKSKAKDKTINEQAAKLHDLPKVCTRIEELSSKNAEKADKAFEITSEQLLKRLVDVMDAGMTVQVVSQGDSLIERRENLPAVVSASNAIAKMCGFNEAEKLDHSSSDGSMSPSQMSAEDLAEEIAKHGL